MREDEDFYRHLVEAAPEVIFSISPGDGTFASLNPAFEKMTGWSRDEWLHRSFADLVHPGDVPVAAAALQRAVKEEGPSSAELRLLSKSGESLIGEIIITPQVRDGTVANILGFVRDVTGRKRAEEELAEAGKHQALSVLASGMAQDFNNLLSSILGNIYLAKRLANPGDRIHERLAEAERASFMAKDLTNELLMLAGIDEPVRRTTLVGGIAENAASLALAGSAVKCDFSLSDSLWPVDVNEEQLGRVIQNLLTNAREAMMGKGVIRVSAANVVVARDQRLPLKEGDYVRISIEDRGIGIAQENFRRIFDPYFTTKDAGGRKGTGLGLAIAYFLTKRQGGLITLESEKGVGTTFHVYLPASLQGVPEYGSTREGEPFRPERKILVMDDDDIDRAVAGEMLRHNSCEVAFARDGREAIETYRRAQETGQPFDALIMDLIIPVGGGARETIKELSKIDPGVKGVVTSGYSHDPVLTDFRKYGFAGALAKPYTLRELGRVLDEIMPAHSAERREGSQGTTDKQPSGDSFKGEAD